MNELFHIMADDMGLISYKNEPSECYAYRIAYSALGIWCLKSALSQKESIKGISKQSQSILLHNLSEKYIKLFCKCGLTYANCFIMDKVVRCFQDYSHR